MVCVGHYALSFALLAGYVLRFFAVQREAEGPQRAASAHREPTPWTRRSMPQRRLGLPRSAIGYHSRAYAPACQSAPAQSRHRACPRIPAGLLRGGGGDRRAARPGARGMAGGGAASRYKRPGMFTFTFVCHPGKTHNLRSRGDTSRRARPWGGDHRGASPDASRQARNRPGTGNCFGGLPRWALKHSVASSLRVRPTRSRAHRIAGGGDWACPNVWDRWHRHRA